MTEFVIFSTKNNVRDNQCLVVGKDKIEVGDYVKILGVTFDNRMNLQKHITNICRSVNIHIRKLLLTFKSLNGCAPEYLCDMLNVYMPNGSLRSTAFTSLVPYRNRSIRLGNNNCLKSNIQCIEIRVQWTMHLGSSHLHVHAVTRVHAVTPKLVICIMYLTSI